MITGVAVTNAHEKYHFNSLLVQIKYYLFDHNYFIEHGYSTIKRELHNNNIINNILISPIISIINWYVDCINDHSLFTLVEGKSRLRRLNKCTTLMMLYKYEIAVLGRLQLI